MVRFGKSGLQGRPRGDPNAWKHCMYACPAVLTRLAQADSFSWDNIAPPQCKPHPYDVNGWPEFERRKSMFEGNDGARRRMERAAVWWARTGGHKPRNHQARCSLFILPAVPNVQSTTGRGLGQPMGPGNEQAGGCTGPDRHPTH